MQEGPQPVGVHRARHTDLGQGQGQRETRDGPGRAPLQDVGQDVVGELEQGETVAAL